MRLKFRSHPWPRPIGQPNPVHHNLERKHPPKPEHRCQPLCHQHKRIKEDHVSKGGNITAYKSSMRSKGQILDAMNQEIMVIDKGIGPSWP